MWEMNTEKRHNIHQHNILPLMRIIWKRHLFVRKV